MKISKKILALLTVGTMTLGTCSCSNKKQKIIINTEKASAYSLEKIEDSVLYKVTSYNTDEAKNKPYEMKKIPKSYDINCTPSEFKNYLNEQNITWNDIKLTIEKSSFDNYHKDLLLKGIANLQNNNFNIDLSVLNYNLKNITIKYMDSNKDSIFGKFDCFEHEITLSKKITSQKKYENVFLHEMLGHGMTCAYIEESKVYCSIDTPTYIIDENNYYVGYSLYGNAFTEAIAQIIALTATNKEKCTEYMCGYDLNIVELLMVCKDTNCRLDEYANYGVQTIINRMRQNQIDDPYKILAMTSYNLEASELNRPLEITSEQIMEDYLIERITDEVKNGASLQELNKKIMDMINCSTEYVTLLQNPNNEILAICNKDYINLTKLYNYAGNYASALINGQHQAVIPDNFEYQKLKK